MRGTADFWGPLLVGIFIIVVGWAEIMKYLRFRRRSERVPGVVVHMQEGIHMKYGVLHYPVLEFTSHGGRQIRTTTRLGTKPAQARIGDRVTVSYGPRNPEEAEIAAQGGVRLAVLVLLVVGGVFFTLLAWM